MKNKFITLLLLGSLCSSPCFAKKKHSVDDIEHYQSSKTKEVSLRSLLGSLDPLSISQHLAFYELYPETKEGKQALSRAWELLNGGQKTPEIEGVTLPAFDIQAIIALVTRQPFDVPVKLSEQQLLLIDKTAARLNNRKLKGSKVWTKPEVIALPPEEIDLGRGLLIFQFDAAENPHEEIRQYEASLDLMALQIAVRLPENPSHEDKIREINRFIFQEMQFRFPPHSIYAKDIDLYTFLPSVLDSRQGVCLGVSILYLCLSQRLDLPLEIITPPGHIYVRYRDESQIINIETTARGINPPSEMYLGINTRSLKERNIKEVIGQAFINQAAVYWGKEEYATSVALYEKALPFLPEDPLLKMLLGFNYLFMGRKREGCRLLEQIKNVTFDDAVSKENIPEDYLKGRIDPDGIKAVFLPVDETRASIIKKQQQLEKILIRYPKFRAGILQLAITWLQLGRGNEALQVLERYHALDPESCVVEYYLAMICIERFDYNRAWHYLKTAENITQARNHRPKALFAVRDALRRLSPEAL